MSTRSRPIPAPPRPEATRPKAAPRPRTTAPVMRETRSRRNKAAVLDAELTKPEAKQDESPAIHVESPKKASRSSTGSTNKASSSSKSSTGSTNKSSNSSKASTGSTNKSSTGSTSFSPQNFQFTMNPRHSMNIREGSGSSFSSSSEGSARASIARASSTPKIATPMVVIATKSMDLESSEYEEAEDINFKPVTAVKKETKVAKRSASPRSRSISPARRISKRIKTKSAVVSSTPLQSPNKRKSATPLKEYPPSEPQTGNWKEKNISRLLTTLGGFDGIGKTLARLLPGYEKSAEAVAAFLLFIYERQLIWRNKKMELLPLTNNKTMAENWFTNMYRELDRGTTYFRSNLLQTVLKKQKGPTAGGVNLELLTKVLYKSVVYRLVNKVETFAGFGNIPEVSECSKFSAYISKKMGKGEKIFTAAHINMGLRRFLETMKRLNKKNIESIAAKIADQAEERSLKGCFKVIRSIKNVGPFLAWQILCDLLECRLLGKCTDNQWTVLGPGAKKGLRIIFDSGFGNRGELGMTRMLRNLCTTDGPESGFEALGKQFPALLNQNLSLKNVEHALCEFSKYYKLALGLKGKERKYNEGTSRVAQDKALKCCVCEENSKTKKKLLSVLCNQCFHLNCLPQRKGSPSSESFLCDQCQVNVDLWKKEEFDFEEDDDSKKSGKKVSLLPGMVCVSPAVVTGGEVDMIELDSPAPPALQNLTLRSSLRINNLTS